MGVFKSGALVGLSISCVTALLAGSTVTGLFAWQIFNPVKDDPEHVDAIVVLAGDQFRVQRGIELAEQGWSPLLVISNGEHLREVAPQCQAGGTYSILCPEPSEDSTRGEARMIARLVANYEWKSLIVVTNDYHAARARMLVDRCLDRSIKVFWVNAQSPRPLPWLVRLEIAKRMRSMLFERSC